MDKGVKSSLKCSMFRLRKAGVTIDEQYSEKRMWKWWTPLGLGGGPREGHTVNIADPVRIQE